MLTFTTSGEFVWYLKNALDEKEPYARIKNWLKDGFLQLHERKLTGDETYTFIHRIFFEYLTAAALYKKEDRFEFIKKH